MWLAWRRTNANQAPKRAGEILLPHLDAGYNLARWLMRDPVRAEDVVQDAALRAMGAEAGLRHNDARAWFLRIVRNTAYDALRATRRRGEDALDETLADDGCDPEAIHAGREAFARLADQVAALPLEWREALVLRELEGLSYREIAEVTAAPIGTVMSRLSRARAALLRGRQT